MATFMNKALAYLGLKDIDDDDAYPDDYDYDEPAGSRAGYAAGRTVYPDREIEEPVDHRPAPSALRPVVGDDRDRDRDRDRDSGPPTQRSAVVRPLVPTRIPTAKVHVVAPVEFGDAQEVGDLVKASSPVILNLQMSDRDLARRMIDFCSGLTYALSGSMEKVAEHVFLLTPSNVEVSAEERMRLQERGLYRA